MTNMEDKATEQEIKTIELEAPEIETEVSEDKVKEEPPSLEEQLAAAEDLAAEYLDGWQRARAEMANFKRRSEAQWAERTLFANVDLLTKLLPVLDDLQLALEKSPENADAAWEEWRQGIALVAHKFLSVLESVGVAPIETDGQTFDPTLHEAISQEEHPELESDRIIATLRGGYMLGDKVLRAAMVRVAK